MSRRRRSKVSPANTGLSGTQDIRGQARYVCGMTPADLVLTPTGLRFLNRRFACSIGRGGLSDHKREGDGATPRGVHALVGMLYRPDRMAKPANWAVAIGPGDLWSDDPADPDYNLMVRVLGQPLHYDRLVLSRSEAGREVREIECGRVLCFDF